MKLNLKRRTKISVYKMMAFIVLIGIAGSLVTRGDLAETKAMVLTDSVFAQGEVVNDLSSKNQALNMELKVERAKPKPQILTDQEARDMIASTFPSQYREDFYKVTAHCENGKLASDAKNINKDGSMDLGMSQVNNKYHKARVEKMFGLDFETAMSMPILNYIYAAYLVEHDKNFHQWACAKIVDVPR